MNDVIKERSNPSGRRGGSAGRNVARGDRRVHEEAGGEDARQTARDHRRHTGRGHEAARERALRLQAQPGDH